MRIGELFRLATTFIGGYGVFAINTLNSRLDKLQLEIDLLNSVELKQHSKLEDIKGILQVIKNQEIESVSSELNNNPKYLAILLGGISIITALYYPVSYMFYIYGIYKSVSGITGGSLSEGTCPSINNIDSNIDSNTSALINVFKHVERPSISTLDLSKTITNESASLGSQAESEFINRCMDDLGL